MKKKQGSPLTLRINNELLTWLNDMAGIAKRSRSDTVRLVIEYAMKRVSTPEELFAEPEEKEVDEFGFGFDTDEDELF